MRKHFLILMLMALFPLAGFAQIDIKDVTPTLSQNSYIYTGATPDVEIHVVSPTTQQEIDDVDWDLVFYDEDGEPIASSAVATDVLNVGTYYVAAKTPEGNPTFRGTTKKVEFNITARPLTISFAQVNVTYGYQLADSYVSDGKDAKFITYTVTDANYNDPKVYDPFSATEATATEGQTFVNTIGLTVQRAEQNQNYNVKYANNEVVGYAFSWNVTDKNYVVTRKTTAQVEEATNFKINPKGLVADDIANITYTAGTHVYNGNKQVGTFANAEGKDYTYDVTWYNNTDLAYEHAVTSPKEVGNYYAKLTGKGNYSGTLGYNGESGNDNKNWKFTITRRPVTLEIVEGTKVYDGKNIDLSTVTINYGNIAPADAQSIINNFGNTIGVAFGDDATNHKDVKYTDGETPTVTHYGLVLKVTTGYEATSLFKNYGFEQPGGEVTAIGVTEGVINGISGKYTITRRPVEFKANQVTTTFGTEPTVAATATIGDASKEADVTGENAKSVLYVAPAQGTTDKGIVVYTNPEGSDLTSFAPADFALSLTPKATKGSDEYDWNVAPADLYKGAVVLVEGETPSEMSKNYDITFTNGDVRVGGMTVRVTVNTTSIKYGDAVSNKLFSYSTNPSNKTLGGTPNYKIFKIAIDDNEEYVKGDEVTDEEILPTGTYWVELDKNGMTAPANYKLGEFNPGYLIVEQKPLTVEVPELTLNVNDTETTLNAYISPKTFETGINNETISFVYSFNTEGEGAVATEDIMDGETLVDKKVISGADSYANGIKGALIAEGQTGYNKANENYIVEFNFGGLKLVNALALVLNQADPNLAAKIAAAAAAASGADGIIGGNNAEDDVKYNVSIAARTLTKDVWYTMVLPFNTTPKDIVAAFDEYIVVNRMSKESTSSHISFVLEMSEIPAGEPFLIKTANDVVIGGANAEVGKFGAQIIYKDALAISGQGATKFIGTYTKKTIQHCDTEDNFRYGWLNYENIGELIPGRNDGLKWENRWYGAKSAHDVLPCEAYLIYEDNYTPAAHEFDFENEPLITVQDADGSTTAISMVKAGEFKAINNDGWYTLNGVKLNAAPTEKGIYINNGKKIVIK